MPPVSPYGAAPVDAHLKSVMWNSDSLDWADPVPSSITNRVLTCVDKAGRGIILLHDIHERTVKALPAILDRLVAEGCPFAGWDGTIFKSARGEAPAPEKVAISTGYAKEDGKIITLIFMHPDGPFWFA